MEKTTLYTATNDPYYAEPYIDEEGWRDAPCRHYYVHGGFKGTEVMGNEVRFCFYFPEKEKYEGRFYQYVSPAPESEHESENLRGEDDKITFCCTHGAYFVVSNQGGFVPGDGERLYKSNANSAQFGREVAKRIYGYDHRPYGYVFGGSGGSFKTMSCIEMTAGVWDGGAPYVIGNPMATPNVFAPRVRVMRLLGAEGMERIVDAMLPGGSGDIYEGLDDAQREALEDATKMGFPKRAWFQHPYMGDGALMVLAPMIYQMAPEYFTDFWTKEGFAGADPGSTEVRDRVRFRTKVKALHEREGKAPAGENNNVDNSWINTMIGNQSTPNIEVEEMPPADSYLFHCRVKVLTGAAAGKEQPIDKFENGIIEISSAFDGQNSGNSLEGLAVGDEILVDNSDYLAMQTFHHHQVPPESSYYTYDFLRNEDGTPKYPQLPFLVAPMIAAGGGGSVQSGKINSKMILNCSLCDESAFPWHGDWYRKLIIQEKGNENDWVRLYYNDNCNHADSVKIMEEFPNMSVFMTDYVGMLHQTLIDLANWVEKGIEPPKSTEYKINDGQVEVENDGNHGGLQPAVRLMVNGQKCVRIKAGDSVSFTAEIEAPVGIVSEAVLSFTNEGKEVETLSLEKADESGSRARISCSHIFMEEGTFFPTIRVKASRDGKTDDIFVQCKNLDKVRVIVTA